MKKEDLELLADQLINNDCASDYQLIEFICSETTLPRDKVVSMIMTHRSKYLKMPIARFCDVENDWVNL